MNKIRKYGDGINKVLETTWTSVEQEVQHKHSIIVTAIKEDLKPYLKSLSDRITDLKRMKANNDYYLKDISSHFKTTQKIIR